MFWPPASWFCISPRGAFVALLNLEVIVRAGIWTSCNSLSNKECSQHTRHFSACWGNSLILDLTTAYTPCFSMTEFSGSTLYFYSRVIYLSAWSPLITQPPYLTTVDGAAWVMCSLTCVTQAHKTRNIQSELETAALRLQVWKTQHRNWSVCISICINWFDFAQYCPASIIFSNALDLGATVLVSCLLLYSRPRTVCRSLMIWVFILPDEPFLCWICDQ